MNRTKSKQKNRTKPKPNYFGFDWVEFYKTQINQTKPNPKLNQYTPSRGLVYLILGGDVYLPLILNRETIFLMGKQSLKITSWIVQFISIVHTPITTQCIHSKECI